jgi:hypothetical protein
MKIRGRQLLMREYVTDLRGRLKEIGGGLGDGLLEEHEKEDDNYIVSLLLGTTVGDNNGGDANEKRANNKGSTFVSEGSGKPGKLASTDIFSQRLRDATKQAYDVIAKDDHKNRF